MILGQTLQDVKEKRVAAFHDVIVYRHFLRCRSKATRSVFFVALIYMSNNSGLSVPFDETRDMIHFWLAIWWELLWRMLLPVSP